jgi:hypothetical protein
LLPLLDDEREALMFGSIEAAASRGHKYRRKDYAYRCIVLALGEQFVLEQDLKLRDMSIDALKRKAMK